MQNPEIEEAQEHVPDPITIDVAPTSMDDLHSFKSECPDADLLSDYSDSLSDISDSVIRNDQVTRTQPTVGAKGMSEDSVPKNGSDLSIKVLYEGPPKCKCCTNWVEQYPDDLRESIEEKEDTKAKAILARMKKSHQDGKPLALDSIVVQNTDLKAFLVELLHGYQGITPNLNKVVLKAPFHPFFYRWDRFKDLMSQNDIDFPAAPPYPSLLYDLLRPEIEPLVDDVNDMVSNKVITYDMLWAIFQPMQELHAELQGHKRMCIHESHDYTKDAFGNDKGFEVVAKYVDWDGEKFGLSSKTFTIKPFSGTKPIDELEVCPFELIKWPEDTRNKLLDRGRKFRELCSVQHKSYKGMALVLDLRRGCYQHTSVSSVL